MITLFGDNEFADDGLAVLEGEAHGVGAFGEVGEIHDGLVAKVVVEEDLLAKGVEDGYLVDGFGALDVELANGRIGIEGDVGALNIVDAHEGDNGNPAGVVAGEVVGGVVEGGLQSDIDVALNIGDNECVLSGGLVAIGPFESGATGADGIKLGSLALVEMPRMAVMTGDFLIVRSRSIRLSQPKVSVAKA